jgi:hypothetical protein
MRGGTDLTAFEASFFNKTLMVREKLRGLKAVSVNTQLPDL